MNQRNITIIGCGWLGLALGESLLADGHIVNGSCQSDHVLATIQIKGIHAFKYKLEDGQIPQEIIDKTEIVILALPPQQKDQINYFGDHLCNLSAQFGSDATFIYTSSIGVYPQRSGNYDEEFLFLEREKNTCLYLAESKLQKLLKERLTILRLGGLFGPGRHPVLALQGKKDVQNPFGFVNLVHGSDVIEVIKLIIDKNIFGELFNLVYPEYPLRQEYYTKLYRNYELESIHFIETPWLERKILSIKIQKKLDFKFQHSIHQIDDCLWSNQ